MVEPKSNRDDNDYLTGESFVHSYELNIHLLCCIGCFTLTDNLYYRYFESPKFLFIPRMLTNSMHAMGGELNRPIMGFPIHTFCVNEWEEVSTFLNVCSAFCFRCKLCLNLFPSSRLCISHRQKQGTGKAWVRTICSVLK